VAHEAEPDVVRVGLTDAAWAWNVVSAPGVPVRDLARKLPLTLRKHGLGQTMAYLLSKRGDVRDGQPTRMAFDSTAEGRLFRALSQGLSLGDRPEEAMRGLVSQRPERYRRLSLRAIALAEWLKRFADGAET
jgi:CRISPR type III-B/RAMP module-associated protein Cmr5